MVIGRLLWFALFLLLVPAISLATFAAQQLLSSSADATFWVLFLVSLTPCGFLACALGMIDVFSRRKTRPLISVGNAAALVIIGVGAIELLGGLLGISLVLLVTGAFR